MSATLAVPPFFARVPWSKYVGATYAWVALRRDELVSLGCRVVLTTDPARSTWEFLGGLDDLVIRRGWIPTGEVQGVLEQLPTGEIRLSSERLVLARAQQDSSYTWTATTHLVHARKPVGWPALHLRGVGDRHVGLAGYEHFQELGARLPGAMPRPFSDWANLGAFLGGEGEPINLGDDFLTVFDCYAPFYARFASAQANSGDLQVAVEASPIFPPELLLASTGGEEPRHLTLDPPTESHPHMRQTTCRVEGQAFPLRLQLVVDGQTVDEYMIEQPNESQGPPRRARSPRQTVAVTLLPETAIPEWADAELSRKCRGLYPECSAKRVACVKSTRSRLSGCASGPEVQSIPDTTS